MDSKSKQTSRLAGFYELALPDRLKLLFERGTLSKEAQHLLEQGGKLGLEIADAMSENVISCHALPLSLGLNFRINNKDHLIPMATEEPSVVAAASHAAKLARINGGFEGHADPSIMTGQIQLSDITEGSPSECILNAKQALLAIGDKSIPNMVARGGGCRDISFKMLDSSRGLGVVLVDIDVGDAMGANMVDTVAECLAPELVKRLGGNFGLRILTNLSLKRLVTVTTTIAMEAIGEKLANAIVLASEFAELDAMRAVTHNKGIMNGIDSVALALGQDFRAIEAGAHGYASVSGTYKPLSTWRRVAQGLEGTIRLPLAVGTVGGSTKSHPGVRAAFEVLGVSGARELAVVMASVGLASNFAALKALASEGIQKGHMRLHHRKSAHQAETTKKRAP